MKRSATPRVLALYGMLPSGGPPAISSLAGDGVELRSSCYAMHPQPICLANDYKIIEFRDQTFLFDHKHPMEDNFYYLKSYNVDK